MKTIKKEKGQSLVEMAISLVFILVLLVGTVELGMAFFQFIQLRDAAQEGALYGSIDPTNSGLIEARTRGASGSPIDLTVPYNITTKDGVQFSLSYTLSDPTKPACEGYGNAIKVTVKYNHKIFMPFIAKIIGRTSIPLTASVTDTILSPVC